MDDLNAGVRALPPALHGVPMRLTQWTDYTLRVLMYCAASAGRAMPVTITEVAEAYGISRSHLMKIVQQLAALGWLETTRGRGGGMRLLRPAADITVGDVVRATETDFHLVECFDPAANQCRLTPHCRLRGALDQALAAYLAALDGVTLADLVAPLHPSGAGARMDGAAPVQWAGLPGLPVPRATAAE